VSVSILRDNLGKPLYFITTVIDITERKNSELEREHLLASEQAALVAANKTREQLSQILERISDGFGSLDRNWCYTFVNERLAQTVERRREDLVGRNIWTEFPEAVGTPVHQAYIRAMTEQVTIDLEHYYTPFGRWFQHRFYPSPDGLSVFSRDITERKQAEEALRESHERLKKVLEVETVGVMFWDLTTGCMIDANETFLNMMGYNRQNVEARELTWQKLTPPEYHDMSLAEIRKFQVSGRVGPYEKEYLCSDGTRKWFVFAGSAVGGNNCVEFCVDISDRKKIEVALRLERDFSNTAIDSLPGVFYCYDENLKFKRWNKNFEIVTGYSGDEIAQMSPIDFYAENEKGLLADRIQEVFNKGESNVEADFVAKDGTCTPYYFTGVATVIDGRRHLVGVGIDISDRKRSEKALLESEERYRAIVSNIPGGLIHIFDREMKYVFNAGEELTRLGLSNEFLVGKSIHEVLPADVAPLVEAQYKRVLAGETVRFEGGYGKDYFSLTSAPLKNAEGEIENILTLCVNITERKRADEALRESEKLYRSLFENMLNGFAYCQMLFENGIPQDYIYLAVNDAFESQTGLKDVVGRKVTEIIPGIRSADPQLFEVLGRVALSGHPEQFEIFVEALQNWFTLSVYSPARGYFVAVFDVITERKRAEEKLKENNALLRIAAEKARLGGWNVDLKESRSYWSDEVASIHEMPSGYAPLVEEGINFYAPEWHNRITKVFTDCAKQGIPYDEEMEIITSTGKRIWVRTIGEAVRDDQGKIFKVQGAFQDISERKIEEEKIREKDLQFRKLSANVPDLIFQFTKKPDGSYCVPVASEGIRNIFGCSPEDVVDDFSPIASVIFPEDSERVIRDIEYSAEHLTYFTCEFRVQIPGKPIQWIFSRSTPEKLPDGSITWYGFNTDITYRKEAEEAIRLLNYELEQRVIDRTSQLEAANKELEAFSYSVSHDLRAPLRHINGYVDLLTERFNDILPEKGKYYLNTISDSAKQMGILIDDLLQFSKTGRQQLRLEELDMNLVINEIIETLEPDTKNRKINWSISTLPHVYGDRSLLGLVWLNLLGNAIKFTKNVDDAKIELGFKEEKQYIIFYVRDNGVGFDMQYVHKLFGVFQRLHTHSEFEGTGIGLANVQRIIIKHGGRVWAEAELNKGASFYFTLPIKTE